MQQEINLQVESGGSEMCILTILKRHGLKLLVGLLLVLLFSATWLACDHYRQPTAAHNGSSLSDSWDLHHPDVITFYCAEEDTYFDSPDLEKPHFDTLRYGIRMNGTCTIRGWTTRLEVDRVILEQPSLFQRLPGDSHTVTVHR